MEKTVQPLCVSQALDLFAQKQRLYEWAALYPCEVSPTTIDALTYTFEIPPSGWMFTL